MATMLTRKRQNVNMYVALFIELIASWRSISVRVLLYLLPSTQYFIAFNNNATCFGPLMNDHQGTCTVQDASINGTEWNLRAHRFQIFTVMHTYY
jgi:hypothetical protein